MKLFLLACSLFTYAAHAQVPPGIGVIQIGKTETEILNDLKIDKKDVVDGASLKLKELGKKSRKSVVSFRYSPTARLVGELSEYTIPNFFEKCLDAVVYRISEYKVDGTTFNNFRLTFYKDTLIMIYTENKESNEEFIRVFKSKYGEGQVMTSERASKEFPDKKSSYTANVWKATSVKDVEIKLVKTTGYVEDDNEFGTGSRLAESFKFSIQNVPAFFKMYDCGLKGSASK